MKQFILLLLVASAAVAAPEPQIAWDLPTLFKTIPPLKHDAKGRLPFICWAQFKLSADDKSWDEGKPFPPETIHELTKRGLTQWIPPLEKYIPFALALQQSGAPVVILQGAAFNGPAADVPDGLHKLPAGFKRDPDQAAQQPAYPCPLLLPGWQKTADGLRATFRKFKDAGVNIDAVWLDWEVEPFGGASQWKEAKACSRCQAMFPPGVLDTLPHYRAFITEWRSELFSAYVAAPILEIYPQCSMTNWEMVISTLSHPTPNWSGARDIPPVGLGMFSGANPVAYGNSAWYKLHWKDDWHWPLDVPHMDRLYTSVMLGEISGHEANAQLMAPYKQSLPWVARYCPDDEDPKIPILSRPRYREILRHCWLRGADTMQIFNPIRTPDKLSIVTEEVADVLGINDEMLAYRKFLDSGLVMNTAYPTTQDEGPIWSGLRLNNEALIRTFTEASKLINAGIVPFPDAAGNGAIVKLDFPPEGATYLLKKTDDKVMVLKQ